MKGIWKLVFKGTDGIETGTVIGRQIIYRHTIQPVACESEPFRSGSQQVHATQDGMDGRFVSQFLNKLQCIDHT
jgi:hypothetical protein